jgi:hypothetical protein
MGLFQSTPTPDYKYVTPKATDCDLLASYYIHWAYDAGYMSTHVNFVDMLKRGPEHDPPNINNILAEGERATIKRFRQQGLVRANPLGALDWAFEWDPDSKECPCGRCEEFKCNSNQELVLLMQ